MITIYIIPPLFIPMNFVVVRSKFWSQKDAEGVDIHKTLTREEITTEDDSMADGVAVLQSTTEATTSEFSRILSRTILLEFDSDVSMFITILFTALF